MAYHDEIDIVGLNIHTMSLAFSKLYNEANDMGLIFHHQIAFQVLASSQIFTNYTRCPFQQEK